MIEANGANRALCAPASVVGALRAATLAGPGGARALREAGAAAGGALWDAFAEWAAAHEVRDPAAQPLPAFAALLAHYTRDTGWGRIDLVAPDDGGAVLVAHEWAEAALAAGHAAHEGAPSCHFTAGLLESFFGRLAGGAVRVREEACAAAGAPACRFRVAAGRPG